MIASEYQGSLVGQVPVGLLAQFFVVVYPLRLLILRPGKKVGDVARHRIAELRAERIDQAQAGDPRGVLDCDFGRQPAAERKADNDQVGPVERLHQVQIEIRQVIDGPHVLGQPGAAEPGA